MRRREVCVCVRVCVRGSVRSVDSEDFEISYLHPIQKQTTKSIRACKNANTANISTSASSTSSAVMGFSPSAELSDAIAAYVWGEVRIEMIED